MAVTTESSTQITNGTSLPPVMNPSYDDHGRVRCKVFTFTQGSAAGDATSTAGLVKLPPGVGRILLNESHIEWSAFGASRVLDIGYTAHTNTDGTAVVEDDNAFDNDIDVSSAGNAALGSDVAAASGKMYQFDSKEGITIFATVAGGTIPAGATLTGYVLYVMD